MTNQSNLKSRRFLLWSIELRRIELQSLTRVVFLSLCVLYPFAAIAQQTDERRPFLQQISQHLFGANEPEMGLEGGRRGWVVLMLAPPGTSLVALSEGYNGVTADLSRAWSNLAVLDRPIEARNGYAVLGPRSIDTIWSEFLAKLMPPVIAPKLKMTRSAAERWLYACNKRPPLRPSKYMIEYRRYENLVRVLISGKDSDLWRLHPELKRFTTYGDALSSVNTKWMRYGYKDQIDSAIKIVEREGNTFAWRKWSMLRTSFDVNRIQVDVVRSIPQTILLPQPGTWAESTIWSRASVLAQGGQRYNFHIARVKIIRPWLDFDTLLSSPELFNVASSGNYTMLSDGTVPSAANFPAGDLSAVADELILVKQIRVEGGGAPASGHPLGDFAYPDAVNLLGYVVRTLPKINY